MALDVLGPLVVDGCYRIARVRHCADECVALCLNGLGVAMCGADDDKHPDEDEGHSFTTP